MPLPRSLVSYCRSIDHLKRSNYLPSSQLYSLKLPENQTESFFCASQLAKASPKMYSTQILELLTDQKVTTKQELEGVLAVLEAMRSRSASDRDEILYRNCKALLARVDNAPLRTELLLWKYYPSYQNKTEIINKINATDSLDDLLLAFDVDEASFINQDTLEKLVKSKPFDLLEILFKKRAIKTRSDLVKILLAIATASEDPVNQKQFQVICQLMPSSLLSPYCDWIEKQSARFLDTMPPLIFLKLSGHILSVSDKDWGKENKKLDILRDRVFQRLSNYLEEFDFTGEENTSQWYLLENFTIFFYESKNLFEKETVAKILSKKFGEKTPSVTSEPVCLALIDCDLTDLSHEEAKKNVSVTISKLLENLHKPKNKIVVGKYCNIARRILLNRRSLDFCLKQNDIALLKKIARIQGASSSSDEIISASELNSLIASNKLYDIDEALLKALNSDLDQREISQWKDVVKKNSSMFMNAPFYSPRSEIYRRLISNNNSFIQ
jgi:hypothetical protein